MNKSKEKQKTTLSSPVAGQDTLVKIQAVKSFENIITFFAHSLEVGIVEVTKQLKIISEALISYFFLIILAPFLLAAYAIHFGYYDLAEKIVFAVISLIGDSITAIISILMIFLF